MIHDLKDLKVEIVKISNPESRKIAIIQSSYYSELNQNMTDFCKETFIRNGIIGTNIHTFLAPGTWEIPLLTKKALDKGIYDAIVTFGVIVKGQTYHFDMIANESGKALMELSVEYKTPIALEVLAVMTEDQAIKRASRDNFNKGIEAANAMLKAIRTLEEIEEIT